MRPVSQNGYLDANRLAVRQFQVDLIPFGISPQRGGAQVAQISKSLFKRICFITTGTATLGAASVLF